MKLSMPLIYAGNPRETADQVAGLEKAGLDTIWVAEPYGFDSPTLMGYLAARTETVEIGAGILNIYSRTPGALLQTAAGLDNVSGGRAVIGLGASGPQVIEGFHGVPYDKPLGRTREIVDILRRGPAPRDARQRRHLQAPAPRGPGHRPRQAAQAAQQARSAPPSPSSWPRSARRASRARRSTPTAGCRSCSTPRRPRPSGARPSPRGTAKRPDALAPLEVSAGGMVAIGEDVKGMLDLMRPMYALYVGGMGARGKNFYNDLACQYGYEKEAKEIQDLYLGGNKRDAEAKVPLEWLEAGNLVGPESYVKERIAAFREAGVTNLQVTPATEDPAATIAQIKEWVS